MPSAFGSDAHTRDSPLSGRRFAALLVVLFCVNALSQIDRILPFILAESIKRDLSLSDTQIGLLTGVVFAVCYALLSLPLARAADRGSPRMALLGCILLWSTMTGLGGLAGGFVILALTRFGVAFGEAGAIPSGHALIAHQVDPGRRGLALGVFSMGIPLGTMVGFVVGGMIGEHLGWRFALFGFGALGLLVALSVFLLVRPTPPHAQSSGPATPFLQSALRLVAAPPFRWLMVGAIFLGFAAAPFYAFAASFLIRTHEFTISQAGLVFGLLQGVMGVVGALAGGRGFDRAMRAGRGNLLLAPALVFLVASATTVLALFAPIPWISVVLMTPAMLSFAFLLPWGFGAAHLVAGRGQEALASSLLVIGTGLLGPALGPLLVGLVSDGAAGACLSNSLGLGLLLVPLASLLAGVAFLVANRRIIAAIPVQKSSPSA